MKFDTPATTNPIDQLKVVGQPVDRIDGPYKTTGTAPYAHDRHDVVPNQAYGYVVGSAIAKGRIASIDLAAAKAAPGVLAIVTADNAGKLGKGQYNAARLLGGPEIEHYHQAIALVVAETFEQARAAAAAGSRRLCSRERRVRPRRGQGVRQARPWLRRPGRYRRRRFCGGVCRGAGAARRDLHHARSGPRDDGAACLDCRLERRTSSRLWTSNQMIAWSTDEMAKTLGIAKENIRLMSPFIGGGFGGKLWLRADALLAALGARAAGRPVKVALPRPLMFNNTVHRPATIQRIRIGATRDGKITAIGHEGWSGNLAGGRPEARGLPDPAALCRGQPPDDDAARGARSSRRQRHAGAGRGAGHDGAGDRHRRDGREARPRSDRVPHPQRHPGRSREARAEILAAPAHRMPAHSAPIASAGAGAIRCPARPAKDAGWSAWAWPPPSATTS